jgi:alkanesulfonate monooxygenase SsuD/methylene tetrahydromethanopterin reductase-like flavin-dependent oxidoreductase (luciferase family)
MSQAEVAPGPAWIGLMMPVQDFGGGFQQLLDTGAEAEGLGFDSIWVGDHLAFRQPVVEAIVTAAMLAARTERVTVGFGVLQLAMRHPVWLAKQLGTLATLAGERVELGVGIGGENPAEWTAAGVPRDERVGRTVEMVAILRSLLAGEPVSWEGRYYELESPALLPAPRQQPKLWMGGRSAAALQRAGELADGWLGLWADERRTRESVEEIARVAAAAGRPTPAAALVVPVLIEPDRRRAEPRLREFVGAQYGIEFERVSRWCLSGDAESVAGALAGLGRAGAEGFVLMPASADARRELESLAELKALL